MSVAGRLLSRFAATAAIAGDRDQREEAVAVRDEAVDRGLQAVVARRAHDDREAEHEDEERGLGRAARSPRGGRRSRTTSASAPAAATHTGAIPASELSAKPTSVAATTPMANRGRTTRSCARRASGADRPGRRSRANARLSTSHSTASATSHGSAISAAKRGERQPARLERQQVREVRDRQQQRRAVGQVRAGVDVRPARAPAAARRSRTRPGVSRTTVASRLSTAVVAGGDGEHHREQPARAAARALRHRRAERLEQPGLAAAVGEDEQRREERRSSGRGRRRASRASSALSDAGGDEQRRRATAATAQSGASRGRATAAARVAASATSAATSLTVRSTPADTRPSCPPGGAASRPPVRSAGVSADPAASGSARDLRRAQPHRPADALGQVPVPAPEQLHRRGHEDRAHDRRVEQDRHREPEAELLQADEAARDEARRTRRS